MTAQQIGPSTERENAQAMHCPVCDRTRAVTNERAMTLGTTKPRLRVLACGAMAMLSLEGRPWFNFEGHRAHLTVLPRPA